MNRLLQKFKKEKYDKKNYKFVSIVNNKTFF